MTADQAETETATMRGRFAVYPQDQGVIVAYKTDLCGTCQACQCGTAQEPLDLTPGGLPKMIGMARKAKAMKGMLKL